MEPKLTRRKFIAAVAALPALLLGAREAHAVHYPAMLCSSCGFGSKKDNCARCGKWMGSTKIPARLCSKHGFGSKQNDCVICGKWIGSSKQRAFIGNCCGFGSKKDNCVICGAWAP